EQRRLAVRDALQLLREIRERRDVIPIEVRVSPDLDWVFLMVRSAVEAGTDAAVGEEIALRVSVGARREIARAEQRRDARDVRAERQRRQIELQLDVLVERLGNAGRQRDFRNRRRRLRRELDPALDLADLVGVLADGAAIADAEIAREAGEL